VKQKSSAKTSFLVLSRLSKEGHSRTDTEDTDKVRIWFEDGYGDAIRNGFYKNPYLSIQPYPCSVVSMLHHPSAHGFV
jgi:hypothetical protein